MLFCIFFCINRISDSSLKLMDSEKEIKGLGGKENGSRRHEVIRKKRLEEESSEKDWVGSGNSDSVYIDLSHFQQAHITGVCFALSLSLSLSFSLISHYVWAFSYQVAFCSPVKLFIHNKQSPSLALFCLHRFPTPCGLDCLFFSGWIHCPSLFFLSSCTP